MIRERVQCPSVLISSHPESVSMRKSETGSQEEEMKRRGTFLNKYLYYEISYLLSCSMLFKSMYLLIVNFTKLSTAKIINSYKLSLVERWGPYIGQNLPKVRSGYCPHEILHRPPRADI